MASEGQQQQQELTPARKKAEAAKLEKAKMKALVKKHAICIGAIDATKNGSKQRIAVVKELKNGEVNDISRLLRSFLAGRFPVPDEVVRKTRKQADFVRCLANTKTCMAAKRQILEQKGGIIGPVASILASLGAAGIKAGIGGLIKAGRNRKSRLPRRHWR